MKMNPGKVFKIFLTMSTLYALLIFYLSSRSELPRILKLGSRFKDLVTDLIQHIEITFFSDIAYYTYNHLDKLEHIVLYFGFGILLYFTFRYYRNTTSRKYAAIFAILTGLAYGAVDEVHQYFVPGRMASTGDLMADGIGLLLAQFAIKILSVISKRINYPATEQAI